MKHTRTRARWVLLAAAVIMAGSVSGAEAHDLSQTTNWMSGGRPGFCVQASVQQNHGWHNISTFATNCSNVVRADHDQYEQFYKVAQWGQPGVHCFDNGWVGDSNTTNETHFYGWDIWNWCNNGVNVNVIITIDSWQYAAAVGTTDWQGGALRPATSHCHCP